MASPNVEQEGPQIQSTFSLWGCNSAVGVPGCAAYRLERGALTDVLMCVLECFNMTHGQDMLSLTSNVACDSVNDGRRDTF